VSKRIAVNVLSISTQPSGGRTYLLNLLEEMTPIAGDDFQFYLLCSGQNVSIFRERLKACNIHFVVFPVPVSNPLVRIALEQLFLPIWLWHKGIDLLFAARNVMPLLASCHTVIGVLSMHLYYAQRDLPWWRRVYGLSVPRLSAKRADAYVAISAYAGHTYMETYNISKDRLFITPLGFRQEQVGNGSPDTSPIDSEYLLFVSTLFPHKNVPFLLRVFAQVARIRPSTALVIVGRDVNGSLGALEKLAQELSISDRVHFLGAVTDNELMQLYAHAHVFVFPSLVEGFGVPVLEAMAHSVPVITSNCTSIPEIVGDAGIVLGPDNEGAWVEATLRILEDEKLRHELSLRASRRAKTFTWRRTAEITLGCFNTVLEAA